MSVRHRLVLASALSALATLGAVASLAVAIAAPQERWVGVGAPAVAVIAAAAAAVMAVGALRTAVGPLETLAGAAGRFGQGPVRVRLSSAADPAVRAIAAALNDASADLRTRQREADRSRSAFRQALTRLGDVLAATHDFEGIVDAVVETALLVVPADAAVFYRLSVSPDHLEVLRARGTAPTGMLLAGGGLAGAAARWRAVATLTTPVPAPGRVLSPAELDPAEPPAVAGIAFPLHSLGRLVGVVAVYGTTIGRPFTEDETGLLVSLMRQVEVAVANIELHERARRDALTDGLTGLCNRRHFDLRLRDAVASAQRYGEPFSVALFDVDDFKRINDRWDHGMGDAALVHLAGLLRTATREVDVACRWGGEEFAVLLQRADPSAAVAVAQRVVEAVRATPLDRDGVTISMTVSAGVASFPGDGRDGAEVVARADTALLRAKGMGKDRVERASPAADDSFVVDVTEREPLAAPGARSGLPGHRAPS